VNKSNGKRSLLCIAGLLVSIIAPVMYFAARILAVAYNNYTFCVQFTAVLALIMPLGGLVLSITGVVFAKKYDLQGVKSGIAGIIISSVEFLSIILLFVFVGTYLSKAHTTPPDYTIAPHYDSEDIESIKATIKANLENNNIDR